VNPGDIGVQFKFGAARLASVATDVRQALVSLPDLDLLLRGMPEQIEAMELCLREISALLTQRATSGPRQTFAPIVQP
jgi:hypothetical protein